MCPQPICETGLWITHAVMYKFNGTEELSSTHRQHHTLVQGNSFFQHFFSHINTAGVDIASPVTNGSHFVHFVYVHLLLGCAARAPQASLL